MKIRMLGKNLSVSEIGLGCMTIGKDYSNDAKCEAERIIRRGQEECFSFVLSVMTLRATTEKVSVREQEMFSAGGVVLSTDGTFDPVHGQFTLCILSVHSTRKGAAQTRRSRTDQQTRRNFRTDSGSELVHTVSYWTLAEELRRFTVPG